MKIRLNPPVDLRFGAWRLALGRHFYHHKVESWGGRFVICVPFFVLSRGYL